MTGQDRDFKKFLAPPSITAEAPPQRRWKRNQVLTVGLPLE